MGGIFLDQGIEPVSLHWLEDFKPVNHQEAERAILNQPPSGVIVLGGRHLVTPPLFTPVQSLESRL